MCSIFKKKKWNFSNNLQILKKLLSVLNKFVNAEITPEKKRWRHKTLRAGERLNGGSTLGRSKKIFRLLQNVWNGSRAHPLSYSMGTGEGGGEGFTSS